MVLEKSHSHKIWADHHLSRNVLAQAFKTGLSVIELFIGPIMEPLQHLKTQIHRPPPLSLQEPAISRAIENQVMVSVLATESVS